MGPKALCIEVQKYVKIHRARAGSGKYSRWEEGWKRFYRDISEKERVDRMVI